MEKLQTLTEALSWGDGWQRYARELERRLERAILERDAAEELVERRAREVLSALARTDAL